MSCCVSFNQKTACYLFLEVILLYVFLDMYLIKFNKQVLILILMSRLINKFKLPSKEVAAELPPLLMKPYTFFPIKLLNQSFLKW